jgi:hypothetical protein
MRPAATGYSGKPLREKLGLRDGMAACFVALPPPLEALASAVAWSSVSRAGAWSEVRGLSGAGRVFDLVHAFTERRGEIEEFLADLGRAIRAEGMIWVSWPKKASGVRTDVTEDVVRGQALGLGLVDVKVAAMDATWSGLKLVIRKALR